jgi:hypothetical protein
MHRFQLPVKKKDLRCAPQQCLRIAGITGVIVDSWSVADEGFKWRLVTPVLRLPQQIADGLDGRGLIRKVEFKM